MKITLISNGHELHEKLLKVRISERIPTEYTEGGLVISLAIDGAVGAPESYRIDEKDGAFSVIGADTLGLFFGIGKLLHSATWQADAMIPVPTEGVVTPHSPVRTLDFPIHFYNWYQNAPTEAVVRYLEDMLLWGYNGVHTGIPSVNAYTLDDDIVVRAAEKARNLFLLAKKYRMKISTGGGSNQGMKSTPHEYDAEMSFNTQLRGDLGRNLCISKPGVLDYLRGLWREKIEKYFKDIEIDYIMCWPYDEGGCGCKDCRPWGARKYGELCKAVRDEYRKYFPNVKVIVSTWGFDAPDDEGEYAGFYRRLREDLDWVDYLLIDSHHGFPKYPLEHPVIKPIINFPEISMWGLYPWGGFGANPLPERFQRIWDECKHVIFGGMPYSEGLYEDITKVQFAGYYWFPDKHYSEILSEYISYEYDRAVTEDVLTLMRLIEVNHTHIANGEAPELAISDRAAALAEAINSRLPERAKNAWRWRILYIRAILDKKRYDGFDQYLIDHADEPRPIKHFEYYSDHVMLQDEDAQNMMRELQGYFCCSEYNGENHWTLPPVGGTRYEVDVRQK